MKNTKGEYLENNQTEPDYLVKNDPQSMSEGKDKQIEKAVQVMLQQLDRPGKKVKPKERAQKWCEARAVGAIHASYELNNRIAFITGRLQSVSWQHDP